MSFDAELMPYCGGIYRVRGRVERFIDEKTGYMKRMKTPAVILEGAYCRARYSNHRMFCPRAIFSWWREIWLERIPDNAQRQRGDGNSDCLPRGLMREEFEDRINTFAQIKDRFAERTPNNDRGTPLQRSSAQPGVGS